MRGIGPKTYFDCLDAPDMALKRISKLLMRPWARLGILLFLGLGCLAPLSGLLHSQPGKPASHGHSEVDDNRIEISVPAAICEHHPEGCPVACHCPKIVPESVGHEDAGLTAGVWNEPSLVQCTEGRSKDHPAPALLAFVPPVTPAPWYGIASRPGWPCDSDSPLDPYRDPPRHVPRAPALPA